MTWTAWDRLHGINPLWDGLHAWSEPGSFQSLASLNPKQVRSTHKLRFMFLPFVIMGVCEE